jgi:hypothetical protein
MTNKREREAELTVARVAFALRLMRSASEGWQGLPLEKAAKLAGLDDRDLRRLMRGQPTCT